MVNDPPRNRATVIEVDADICAFCPTEAQVEAYVYAKLASGRTLALCAHHGTAALPKLHAEGAKIIDQRHRLTGGSDA